MLLSSARRAEREVSSTATRIYQISEWVLILSASIGHSLRQPSLPSYSSDTFLRWSFPILFDPDSWTCQLLLGFSVVLVVSRYEARSRWLSLLLYVVIFPQSVAQIKCQAWPVSSRGDLSSPSMLSINVQLTTVSYLYACLPHFRPLGTWTPHTDVMIQFLGYALSPTQPYTATFHLHVLQLTRMLVGTSLNTIELSLLSHALSAFTIYYGLSSNPRMAETFTIAFLYGLLIAVYPAIPALKSNIRLARIKPQHRPRDLMRRRIKFAIYTYAIVTTMILTVVRGFLSHQLPGDPFVVIAVYLVSSPIRLVLVLYWLLVAGLGIVVVIYFWGSKPVGGLMGFPTSVRRLLRHSTENDLAKSRASEDVFFEEEDTLARRARALDRRRKFFHGLVVILFLPTINQDPELTYLVLSLAFTAFVFVELLRVTVLPPLGVTIHKFLSGFTDHRDKVGHLVVSHLFLLLGIAGPVWLSLTGEDFYDKTRSPADAMMTGVLSLGMGDAAASIIGKKYGKHKWPASKKSIEGTVAFVLAMMLGEFIVKLIYHEGSVIRWKRFVVGVLCTGIMEAVSSQNDNLIIPIYMWCHIF